MYVNVYVSSFEREVIARFMMYDSTSEKKKRNTDKFYEHKIKLKRLFCLRLKYLFFKNGIQ